MRGRANVEAVATEAAVLSAKVAEVAGPEAPRSEAMRWRAFVSAAVAAVLDPEEAQSTELPAGFAETDCAEFGPVVIDSGWPVESRAPAPNCYRAAVIGWVRL